MSSSFVSGMNKVLAGTEPRIVILYGNEVALQQHLVKEVVSRDMVVADYSSGSIDTKFTCFFASQRQSCSRVVVIEKAEKSDSWDWLQTWLEQTKKIKLILLVQDTSLALRLEKELKTRALLIDCSAPTGAAGQAKLIKYLVTRYNQSVTQLNLLLNRNNWYVSECIELLDKLAILNLSLDSETASRVGIVKTPYREFLHAMQCRDTSRAMSLTHRLSDDEKKKAVVELSHWLDTFTRVKFASGYMKPASEVSAQTGVDRKTVESLQPLLRKYDEATLNKAAITLASTERVMQKFSDGALELMVNNW